MVRRLSETLKRAYLIFRSANSTVAIISALLVLYFLGLIIPQKEFMPSADAYTAWKSAYPFMTSAIEFLGLNDIYLAPITIFFLVIFFVNLLVVVGNRVPVIMRRMYLLRRAGDGLDGAAAAHSDNAKIITVSAEAQAVGKQVQAFLKKQFWSIVGGDGIRSIVAVKNRYSPSGFLLFHASFLLCLIGGILVMYTRFSGTFILGEGQEFTPDLRNFRQITRDPKMMKELEPFYLKLERTSPRYEKDVNSDLDVDVVMTYDGNTARTRLKVNEPLKRGPLSILSQNLGVSPLMVLRDESGRELAGSYFILNVLNGQEDSFEFPEVPYVFSARFFADYFEQEGKSATHSRELNNPVMLLTITRKGNLVRAGLLPLGRSISFDGLTLSFEGVRYWVEFYVVREYGNYLLFTGFACGITGLVLRLLFYQKKLWITVEEKNGTTTVMMSGTSEYYPYSFVSEKDALANDLQNHLATVTPRVERAAPGSFPAS